MLRENSSWSIRGYAMSPSFPSPCQPYWALLWFWPKSSVIGVAWRKLCPDGVATAQILGTPFHRLVNRLKRNIIVRNYQCVKISTLCCIFIWKTKAKIDTNILRCNFFADLIIQLNFYRFYLVFKNKFSFDTEIDTCMFLNGYASALELPIKIFNWTFIGITFHQDCIVSFTIDFLPRFHH